MCDEYFNKKHVYTIPHLVQWSHVGSYMCGTQFPAFQISQMVGCPLVALPKNRVWSRVGSQSHMVSQKSGQMASQSAT